MHPESGSAAASAARYFSPPMRFGHDDLLMALVRTGRPFGHGTTAKHGTRSVKAGVNKNRPARLDGRQMPPNVRGTGRNTRGRVGEHAGQTVGRRFSVFSRKDRRASYHRQAPRQRDAAQRNRLRTAGGDARHPAETGRPSADLLPRTPAVTEIYCPARCRDEGEESEADVFRDGRRTRPCRRGVETDAAVESFPAPSPSGFRRC
jgi:hypothetical protein